MASANDVQALDNIAAILSGFFDQQVQVNQVLLEHSSQSLEVLKAIQRSLQGGANATNAQALMSDYWETFKVFRGASAVGEDPMAYMNAFKNYPGFGDLVASKENLSQSLQNSNFGLTVSGYTATLPAGTMQLIDFDDLINTVTFDDLETGVVTSVDQSSNCLVLADYTNNKVKFTSLSTGTAKFIYTITTSFARSITGTATITLN